jgi:hypothetical protein
MQFRKFAVAAAAICSAAFGQSCESSAAELAVEPAVQMIGPLYALGPDQVEPPRYRPRTYAPRPADRNYRPQYRNDTYGNYRNRNYRPYQRDGYGRDYGYSGGYRNRYTAPYIYARPRYPRYGEQEQYAARIVPPRWNGEPRTIGPVYQARPYSY